MTFPVFLKLLRLFQVVGKIDDTLALLNLVSLSFGFCLAQLPGGAPAARAGPHPLPGPRTPPSAPLPPSLPPGLHDEHHLPAVHGESQGLPPPLPPGGPACPPAQEGSAPRRSLLRSSQATGRPGAWTTGLQRGENFPGEGPTLGFQAGRSGEASRAPGGAVGGRDQPGLQGRSEGRPLRAP